MVIFFSVPPNEFLGCGVHSNLKAMTHQPTQLLSRSESGPVGICVIGLQLDFFLHSSLIPNCLVGSGPTYDSTVGLGDVSWPLLSLLPMVTCVTSQQDGILFKSA